ncbi:hypothetical protein [Salinarimonas soli]|uniref:Uncharacterized protein n=1 Tax=Salinarimonas soli TaxID=1638099 RepID=A0A5B2VFK7_9HYPH|nr:hypothetical protein [Salinarimonas soli]KAA2237089.1 hypothetical protein F0L46_11545 [Salinarimonas soli]
MRRIVLALSALAALAAAVPAEAQTRRSRDGDALILNVRPRSYLDAGNVVAPGTYGSNYAAVSTRSYLSSPPWINQRDRFGEGVLPDPITNGPFVGARNPFGPVDYVAPDGFR